MGDAENFIPWSQIKPLVKPGMTAKELGAELAKRLGLPNGTYGAVTCTPRTPKTMRAALKYGLRIVSRDSAEYRAATAKLDLAEVIA